MDNTDIVHNYYILVTSDVSPNRLTAPSAYDVAQYRLSRGVWGLNSRTVLRKSIKSGDKVLIYISGRRENRQCFISHAVVGSRSRPTNFNNRAEIDAPFGKGVMVPEFFIILNNVFIFKSYVSIRKCKNDLELIKSPEVWWRFIQGGIKKISKNDFEKIVQLSNMQI